MGVSRKRQLEELQALIDAVPADAGFNGTGKDANPEEDGSSSERGSSDERPSGRKPSTGRGRRGSRRTPSQEDGGLTANRKSRSAKKAYERAIELCSYGEFCSVKMTERLVREEFSPEAAEAAVAKAVRVGLIDDLRWGEMRASGLMRHGMGVPGVERELRRYGIDPDEVDGWPYAFEERFGNDFDRALAILEAKPPRSKNPRASAYARLLRKGYSSSVASQASETWHRAHGLQP